MVHALSTPEPGTAWQRSCSGTVASTTGAGRVLLLAGEGDRLTVRAVWEHGDITTVEGPWAEVGHDHAIVARVVD